MPRSSALWIVAVTAGLTAPAFAQEVATAGPAIRPSHLAALDRSTEPVGVGVTLRTLETDRLFESPQSIAVLTVDLSRPTTRIRVAAPDPFARVATSELARRAGALAAVNGGFFDTSNGHPNGLVIQDGKTRAGPAGRALGGAIGVDGRGRVGFASTDGPDLPAFVDGLGAWPMLLRAGAITRPEGFSKTDRRHPRTAVGVAADGRLLLVTVDGRHPRAAGMTLVELAELMRALGCRDALNLDGGGSTTMWIRHLDPQVVNHPSDNEAFDAGGERTVANALLVLAPAILQRDEDCATPEPTDALRSFAVPGAIGGDAVAIQSPGASLTFTVDLPSRGPWHLEVRRPPAADGARPEARSLRIAVLGPASSPEPIPVPAGAWTDAGEVPGSDEGPVRIRIDAPGEESFDFDAIRLVEQRAPDPGRR